MRTHFKEKADHIWEGTATVTGSGSYLRLGYADDGYGDNGYYAPDPGNDDHCIYKGKHLGDAWVHIIVHHGGGGKPPPAQQLYPMNLYWDTFDDNYCLLNPRWGWQDSNSKWQRDFPGSLPNVRVRGTGIPFVYQNPYNPSKGVESGVSTNQDPTVDNPSRFNEFICDCGAGPGNGMLQGHLNWMPVTYQGYVTWAGHDKPADFSKWPPFGDDDYNLDLSRKDHAGSTETHGGSIHCEFDSDETIDDFQHPWWVGFHQEVDADKTNPGMINGKPAIITGLMGLDSEHEAQAELHPVYALAICVNEDPNDETWALFVRNWGDEGFCSSQNHELHLVGDHYTFRFPWRRGATSVTVLGGSSVDCRKGVSPLPVEWATGDGVRVTFKMPGPEARGFGDGILHLQWAGKPEAHVDFGPGAAGPVAKGGLGKSMKPPVKGPVQRQRVGEAENYLAGLGANLSKKQIQDVQAQVAKMKRPRRSTPTLTAFGPATALKRLPSLPTKRTAAIMPKVRPVFDRAKMAIDKARSEALKTAFGGKIPPAMDKELRKGGIKLNAWPQTKEPPLAQGTALPKSHQLSVSITVPTGGYTVTINEVRQVGKELWARVDVTPPRPGGRVTQTVVPHRAEATVYAPDLPVKYLVFGQGGIPMKEREDVTFLAAQDQKTQQVLQKKFAAGKVVYTAREDGKEGK